MASVAGSRRQPISAHTDSFLRPTLAPISVSSTTSTKSSSFINLKLTLRLLPPCLTEEEFHKQLSNHYSDTYEEMYYVKGNLPATPYEPPIYSRAYISFRNQQKVDQFLTQVKGKTFVGVNENSIPVMEKSIYSKMPGQIIDFESAVSIENDPIFKYFEQFANGELKDFNLILIKKDMKKKKKKMVLKKAEKASKKKKLKEAVKVKEGDGGTRQKETPKKPKNKDSTQADNKTKPSKAKILAKPDSRTESGKPDPAKKTKKSKPNDKKLKDELSKEGLQNIQKKQVDDRDTANSKKPRKKKNKNESIDQARAKELANESDKKSKGSSDKQPKEIKKVKPEGIKDRKPKPALLEDNGANKFAKKQQVVSTSEGFDKDKIKKNKKPKEVLLHNKQKANATGGQVLKD